ncbi:cytochrome ubiquinol oxidase subunit I [Ruegeria sp. 6PALISEP08]|uniref:cytochrome ubiquinol oxidase subunit I n=1 Tax=Ruegeria sp. 6PALISEP08 TaxID=1225660 RepID=UPI00067EEA45
MPYRLAHMLMASGLTVAFLILRFPALRWLIGDLGQDARATFNTVAWIGAILIPAQIYMGDLSD